MIKEQYISFDTARMLKDASFDVPCRRHYTKSGSTWETAVPETIDDSRDFTWFPCPTQALAARWLREVYGFCISVDYWKPDDALFYCNITQFRYGTHRLRKIYSSYEEALEDGIQDCLKRINR